MTRTVLLPVAAAAALAVGCGAATGGPDVAAAAKAAGAELLHPEPTGDGIHTDERVQYATNPPASGPHAFDWAADGSYVGVEPPSTGQLVHAQEHGRIVIQYRRGLPRDQVAQLEALFDEKPYHVILVENRTDMPCDVAAAAWGHVLRCRSFNDKTLDAIRAFRDAYVDQGPEQIP
jgi:hypothetical protein